MKRAVTVAALAVAAGVLAAIALAAENWSVHLTGDQENPPAGVTIDTQAQGQASFHLNKEGDELRYKLNVANIENVTQAHIHCGPPALNGPITVWLYPDVRPPANAPGGGRIQGRIADGVITDANVIRLPSSTACPGGISGFADLLAKIRSGGAYVNVHTSADAFTPFNTGPGDFPGGEIRGNLP